MLILFFEGFCKVYDRWRREGKELRYLEGGISGGGMSTRDSVLEVDGVIEFSLEVRTELIHVQIVGILAERVLNLGRDGLHTEQRERNQAHQGNRQPAQSRQECEGQSQAVEINDLTQVDAIGHGDGCEDDTLHVGKDIDHGVDASEEGSDQSRFDS